MNEFLDSKYYVPYIKLIGYGRAQTYQCVCVKCGELYFNFNDKRELTDLFCSWCTPNEGLLNEDNISFVNFVGHVVGWEIKSSECENRKRSFYNYNKVYKRDCYQCQYCGYSLKNSPDFRALHIDHLKPWSAGGSNKMDNLVVACSKCNSKAGNKWFKSFYEKKKYINQFIPEINNVVWEFIKIEC